MTGSARTTRSAPAACSRAATPTGRRTRPAWTAADPPSLPRRSSPPSQPALVTPASQLCALLSALLVPSAQYGEATALAAIAAALRNTTEAAFFRAEAAKWQGVLQRLWSEELAFFVTESQPPPPNLHAELRRMGKLGRVREVQTYFGCLACDRKRTCPPEGGWPQGKRVAVRELMGLTSPWYFSAVPRADPRVATYAQTLEPTRLAILPSCHPTILHPTTLLSCNHPILPPCHLTILPPYSLAVLPPLARYAEAFKQLDDPQGFGAK